MAKVYVYIPNMGKLDTDLVSALFAMVNVEITLPQGIIPIDNARNWCVADFMKKSNHEDDRLLFIDSDIIPQKGTVEKLLSHDKDIVGTLCLVIKVNDKTGVPTPVPMALRLNEKKEYKVFFDGKGLTEVDATGSGCVMIKRKVFQKLQGRFYQFLHDGIGNLEQVEDFGFCEKAKENGFKIFVDYSLLSGHKKEINLNDINNLLMNCHG